ncbi:hypothetical protein EVAR_55703_1 [Eumeta japonica]|uniref:Uncharacterized protein n=1 Tax=Eumeta variegata TaxID=151549 RepID=A0A4C1Z9F4_EUMVA|nr:hypothetical protein EVAR_55703_1 [Eumeta japonica]
MSGIESKKADTESNSRAALSSERGDAAVMTRLDGSSRSRRLKSISGTYLREPSAKAAAVANINDETDEQQRYQVIVRRVQCSSSAWRARRRPRRPRSDPDTRGPYTCRTRKAPTHQYRAAASAHAIATLASHEIYLTHLVVPDDKA